MSGKRFKRPFDSSQSLNINKTERPSSSSDLYPLMLQYSPVGVWREDEIMVRKRSRLHAKILTPNDNVTMIVGNKVLTDSVFRETGLDSFLNGLKRSQGNSVSAETIALVANSVEMTGLSVNRLDRLLENDAVRREYGPMRMLSGRCIAPSSASEGTTMLSFLSGRCSEEEIRR